MMACMLLPLCDLLGQTDLRELLKKAEERYPGIAAKRALAETYKADVSLEKNTRIPSMDAIYHVNYSTYNNITGMNSPTGMIPISGPPLFR